MHAPLAKQLSAGPRWPLGKSAHLRRPRVIRLKLGALGPREPAVILPDWGALGPASNCAGLSFFIFKLGMTMIPER